MASDHYHDDDSLAYDSIGLVRHMEEHHRQELTLSQTNLSLTDHKDLVNLHGHFHEIGAIPRWARPQHGTLRRSSGRHASDSEEAYRVINEEIVPETLALFREKQRDYTGGPAFLFLGSKGQFSDINRKFWKLYAAVWEEKELEGEQPEEIVKDFIGHCFLLLYTLREEQE